MECSQPDSELPPGKQRKYIVFIAVKVYRVKCTFTSKKETIQFFVHSILLLLVNSSSFSVHERYFNDEASKKNRTQT